MTRLSVIIPCYNIDAYVGRTLQSLRRNAAPDIEFVLVDDASNDKTGAILADQLDRVPGARLVTQPVNAGLAAARNAGLAAARGEYLAFLDGDDFAAPGYFAALLEQIRRFGCDMVRTDHVRVVGRERTVHRINHGPRGRVGRPRDAILPVNRPTSVDAPNAWAGIYHRRLLDAGHLLFDEHLKTCEDRPWIWRLHLHAESMAVVGLIGIFYRRDVVTSLTRIVDERQFDFVPAFDQIVAAVLADQDADLLLPKAIRSYCAIMHHHLKQRDRYDPVLADRLTTRCAAALNRLPAVPLTEALLALDTRRSAVLDELRPVAA